jgi:hypothetical protein
LCFFFPPLSWILYSLSWSFPISFPFLKYKIMGFIVTFLHVHTIFFVVVVVHLFTCAYIVWVISPPCPLSQSFPPSPPQFQEGPVLPLSLILLKKRHKYNKKDKAFLLVELRIAIQRNSYYCFRVPMCYDPC